MLENKRIFVSGGAGVIGTALVQKLHKLGAILFVGDLKPRPKNWNSDIIYYQGDLNHITKGELETINPEYFFHLAATFERSEETWDFWDENFHNNIKLSHHLMTCLKDCKSLKKVIFASSYLIYDPQLYSSYEKPQSVTRLKETDRIYPRNTCGAAKLLHEIENRFLEGFQETPFKTVSARIFRVYGRNSKDVISRWIRMLLNNETITVYKPENRFDYIFADDVADGLIHLATSSARGVVNLGRDNSRSIEEVLTILKRNFPNMKYNFVNSDIPYEYSQANMELFNDLTGWIPTTQLEDGIDMLIEFEKSNKENFSNKEINILVTAISKKVPLLKCLKNSNHKLGNKGKIIGADSDINCIGKYFVDSFWKMPRIENLRIEELLEFLKSNKISCIIPTRNGDLSFFAQHKEFFEKNNIHVMIASTDTVRICLDKVAFYNETKKYGFPSIQTSEMIEEIKSPYYVVKERYGAGSRGIGIHLTEEESISHAKNLESPIFQPFIEGKEYSVDLYVNKKGRTKGAITRTRELVLNGESQITETVQFPELEKLCSQIAENLKLYGHSIFQILIDPFGKFHIIECNPRFGGASTLSVRAGLDSFYWFLIESLDEDLDNYPFIRTSKEIKQIRFAEDMII